MSIWMGVAFAAQYGLLPVQGLFADDTGAPLNGTQEITVTLHTSATGGVPLWDDTFTVQADRGFFSVNLGMGELLDVTLLGAGDLWLSITPAGGVASERVPVGWAPRAAYAARTDPAWVAEQARGAAYDTPAELTTALAGTYRPMSYVPAWSEITGRPSGLDDGDNDTTYTPGVGLLLAGGQFSVKQSELTPSWLSITGRPAGLDDGDNDTTYTAGAGLQLAATQFSVKPAELTPAWSNITGRPSGLDDGDNDTTYTAGTGLQLAATQFSVKPAELTPAWSNITGRPAGLDDGDNDTTYAAGAGLTLTATTFAVNASAAGRSTFNVYGRNTCPDTRLVSGTLGTYAGGGGGSQAMCLNTATLPSSGWVEWNEGLVHRAVSNTAGNRSQYLNQTGHLTCAVCEGYAWTNWGTTGCPSGWSKLYDGYIAGLSIAWSGSWNHGESFCLDSAYNGSTGWVNWDGALVVRANTTANRVQYQNANHITCAVCY
jgi:hypothetical protein